MHRKQQNFIDFVQHRAGAGFTLVELIMVIGVLAILSTAVFFAIRAPQRLGASQDARRVADVEALAKAVGMYTLDNNQIPTDFSSTTIGIGNKFVLCSTSGTLTCDGQSRGCAVIDDVDFIGKYLPSLPIDPSKASTSDTGYYITRKTGDKIAFGACSPYNNADIESIANAALPTYSTTCGDGNLQGSEVCDDGDNFNEGCGNNAIEIAGAYCNSTCSAVITISTNESCDYIYDNVCYTDSLGWLSPATAGSRWLYCDADCLHGSDLCIPPPG